MHTQPRPLHEKVHDFGVGVGAVLSGLGILLAGLAALKGASVWPF
ncbi:MAG: hypothetical protein V3S31_07760 [Dehalococcoidia bacterium]